MRAEDFSDLQRLLRVTALVLKTMKSSLQKDIPSPSESAAQDIMVDAKTIWIKEVQKSLRYQCTPNLMIFPKNCFSLFQIDLIAIFHLKKIL